MKRFALIQMTVFKETMACESGYDSILNILRRDASHRAGIRLVALQESCRHIIAIANAALHGIARRHSVAAVVEQLAEK